MMGITESSLTFLHKFALLISNLLEERIRFEDYLIRVDAFRETLIKEKLLPKVGGLFIIYPRNEV